MKETILYFHVNQQVKEFLQFLEKQLHIRTKEIKTTDIHMTMKSLLEKKEDSLGNINAMISLTDPLIYFAGMSGKQVNLLLGLLKQAQLPPLPYKAVETPTNLNFTFYELYQEIHKEHEMMTKR